MSARSIGTNALSYFLTIPPSIYFFNAFYTTCKIRGNSMAPTLQDGDVVLVKKVDFLPNYLSKHITIEDLSDESESSQLEEFTDLQRSQRMDEMVGVPRDGMLTAWRSPPVAAPGEILVFKNPNVFGHIDVKRLIALNGQRVRPKNSYQKIEHVKPYSVWVEGDNDTNISGDDSIACNGYCGSVSKKLIVGKVQSIIWPLSRRAPIRGERPALGRAWWP